MQFPLKAGLTAHYLNNDILSKKVFALERLFTKSQKHINNIFLDTFQILEKNTTLRFEAVNLSLYIMCSGINQYRNQWYMGCYSRNMYGKYE